MPDGAGGSGVSGGGVSGYCVAATATATASCSMNSVAVSCRWRGSFARHVRIGCTTDSGRLGFNFRGEGGGVIWCAAITPSGVGALKGTRPVTISNAMTPSA